MASLRLSRFAAFIAAIGFVTSFLHAEPQGVISTRKYEGVILTTLTQPEFFIFQSGTREEHFDGSISTIDAQGGIDVGEPITGLHYLRPRLSVDAAPWSPADKQLLDAAFHGGSTADFYLFKTFEGQLFYLPKEGQTKVVRIDYYLRGGQKVTVWTRK